MIRMIMISVTMVTAMAVIPVSAAEGTAQQVKPSTEAFLRNAGEMQRVQISLALLVDERTANDRVRRFGEHLIAVHKKLFKEVEELAAEKSVHLLSEVSDEHKRKMKELSQLSGHTFDGAYMEYMLRDHQRDVQEFEEGMRTVEDSEVLHWTYRTLPMLRAHVEEARWLQQSLQTN